MSALNQKSSSSIQKQITSNNSTSSPTLKSASALSRNTSRSPKSRASNKSPNSKRSPSPKSRLKQPSVSKTSNDDRSETRSNAGGEETEFLNADNNVDEKALISESIVEEPVEQEQPLVIYSKQSIK